MYNNTKVLLPAWIFERAGDKQELKRLIVQYMKKNYPHYRILKVKRSSAVCERERLLKRMVNRGTWLKLFRQIFDSELWTDVTTLRLFLLLLGKASHRDGVKIAGIDLKRGQYLRSYRKLAEDL